MNGYSFIFYQGNISNLSSKKQGLRTEKNWKKVGEKLTSLIFYRVFATPFPLP
jgi:hypothetical protein